MLGKENKFIPFRVQIGQGRKILTLSFIIFKNLVELHFSCSFDFVSKLNTFVGLPFAV